ncbi:hypothetical protein JRQ81_011879, partial [Phrynocephalus forsythii]
GERNFCCDASGVFLAAAISIIIPSTVCVVTITCHHDNTTKVTLPFPGRDGWVLFFLQLQLSSISISVHHVMVRRMASVSQTQCLAVQLLPPRPVVAEMEQDKPTYSRPGLSPDISHVQVCLLKLPLYITCCL